MREYRRITRLEYDRRVLSLIPDHDLQSLRGTYQIFFTMSVDLPFRGLRKPRCANMSCVKPFRHNSFFSELQFTRNVFKIRPIHTMPPCLTYSVKRLELAKPRKNVFLLTRTKSIYFFNPSVMDFFFDQFPERNGRFIPAEIARFRQNNVGHSPVLPCPAQRQADRDVCSSHRTKSAQIR